MCGHNELEFPLSSVTRRYGEAMRRLWARTVPRNTGWAQALLRRLSQEQPSRAAIVSRA
jgi:hypothetical protein